MGGKHHEGAATRHNAAASFGLGAVSIGLGNPDHHGRKGALAEIPVTVGPFHFKAFVRVDGYVSLPDELRDEGLRVEIAIEAHEVVLGALGARWRRQQERMREHAAHLASQRAGGQGNGYAPSRPAPVSEAENIHAPPVLAAALASGGKTVRARCPHRRRRHTHGAPGVVDGTNPHRLAHCRDQRSPYQATGYVPQVPA